MIDQYVDVYAGVRGVIPPVWVVQGDTGRVLIVRFKDYVLSGDEGVSLVCRRPDKSVYTYSGTINQSNNSAKIYLVQRGGALTQEGHVDCMVLLSRNDQIVDSFPLVLVVLPNVGGIATQAEKTFMQGIQSQLDAKANTADSIPNTRTVNGKALTADVVLKAANFSEEITGQKMFGGLTYRVLRTI